MNLSNNTLVTATGLGIACGTLLIVSSGVTAQCQSKYSKTSAQTASQCTQKSDRMPVMLGSVGGTDIVDTAVSAGQFKTLVAAVQAAGLVDALKGEGPFTVFAPTDAAFAKLPAGTVESLLQPENRKALVEILTYHVVPGELMGSDVVRLGGAKTLEGQRIMFTNKGDRVMVDGATISKADISCRNGVIHVIDTVIMPTSDNIVQVASSAGMFSTLLTAATKAGLADALQGDGPYTLFAPTDEAFTKLPAGTVESLLKPENKDTLVAVLKYHVVPGRIYAADAVTAGRARTLQGGMVQMDIRDGALYVDGARIIKTDIDASNGVIHVIDEVILP